MDLIRTAFVKGGTLGKLAHSVFPCQIVEMNNSEKGDEFLLDVFVFTGAVDLSDAISDNLAFNFNGYISK